MIPCKKMPGVCLTDCWPKQTLHSRAHTACGSPATGCSAASAPHWGELQIIIIILKKHHYLTTVKLTVLYKHFPTKTTLTYISTNRTLNIVYCYCLSNNNHVTHTHKHTVTCAHQSPLVHLDTTINK